MGDLALRWDAASSSADLQVVANDLATTADLRPAIILSLFTDRLAPADAVLPSGGTDRRGWWADALATQTGDRFGSHLWLLAREAQRTGVLERARLYAEEALAWLVEDGVASKVQVLASFPDRGLLTLQVVVWVIDPRWMAPPDAIDQPGPVTPPGPGSGQTGFPYTFPFELE